MFDAGPLGGFDPRKARRLWIPGTGTVVPWHVPRNAIMVSLVCTGGGGGGGGGQTSATGVAANGGGGGAPGTSSRLLIPAAFLPRILYLFAGLGGAGGNGGVNGTAGGSSFVTDSPFTSSPASANTILISDNGPAPGGLTAGTGALNATAAVTTQAAASALGIWNTTSNPQGGQAGGVAGNNPGGNITWGANASCPFSGGAGGGGCDTTTGTAVGGDILGLGGVPTLKGGTAAGGNGSHGLNQFLTGGSLVAEMARQVFAFSGGAGGGGQNGGTGGTGGNGGYACGGGGGGGGGGTGGGTGGKGGAGGPGFILVMWW